MTLRRISPVLLALASALAISACGSSSNSTPTHSAAPTNSPKTVSVALSWTPNTDYTGVYVAQELGYYKDRGISLKVLPYASTPPETLVAAGKADVGFSYQAGLAYARAAGKDIVSIFSPDQKSAYAIGVRANRTDIKTPKDLDGKTYAGFGSPDEGPELKSVIQNAGGKGNFKTITLNTSAYQAVYSGAADFTIPVTTWEGVEAKQSGKPLKYFRFEDFGFPKQYSVLIVASNKWLKEDEQTARAFTEATTMGYEYAAKNPAKAAPLMVKANPGAFKNAKLVTESQELLASGGYLTTADGKVGVQSAEQWTKYGHFLYSNGLLTDSNGKPLKAEPDWSAFWTNKYLP